MSHYANRFLSEKQMAWSYPLYSFRWPPREPGVAAWSLPLLLWGFTAARQQKEGVEIESGMCLLRCPKCAVRGNEMRIYFPIGNTSIDHPSRPKTGLPKPPPPNLWCPSRQANPKCEYRDHRGTASSWRIPRNECVLAARCSLTPRKVCVQGSREARKL